MVPTACVAVARWKMTEEYFNLIQNLVVNFKISWIIGMQVIKYVYLFPYVIYNINKLFTRRE